MGPSDIDGVTFTVPLSEAGNPFWSNYATDYLGISARWLQTSDIGGASATGNVARAAMAIQNGWCETVMILGSDAPSTNWRASYGCYRNEFWDPGRDPGSAGRFRPLDEPLHGPARAGFHRAGRARGCPAQRRGRQ